MRVLIPLTLLWALSPNLSAAVSLRAYPGESMVFEFQQPGVPPVGTDTLVVGYPGPFYKVSSLKYELYDGKRLLGSLALPLAHGVPPAFRSVSSEWISNSAVVDFQSIANGTANGRLKIIPSFSGTEGYAGFTFGLRTVNAVGSGSFWTESVRELSATSQSIVPEPSTLTLLAIGCAAIGRRRRCSHQA